MLPGHCMGTCGLDFFFGYLAIWKGSHSNFMRFNVVFELDSHLFLAAAAAEGAEQSNKTSFLWGAYIVSQHSDPV